ncbi:MAG: hypothetical protein CUN56_17055, partial [Phototrophicales bacterium]
KVARDAGMRNRINTVMQTCFFAISGVLPQDEALEQIKAYTRKTYSNKGERIVQMNLDAINQTLDHLYEVDVPETIVESETVTVPAIRQNAPVFVRDVLGAMAAGKGDYI